MEEPWDNDSLASALVHRRVHLATIMAAAHNHDSIAEVERELAQLDADIAAGVGTLAPDRIEALRKQYLAKP